MGKRITIAVILLSLCGSVFYVFGGQLEGGIFQQQEKSKPLTEEEKKKQAAIVNRVKELKNPAHHAFATGEYDEALAAVKEICDLQPDVITHQSFLGDVAFAACDMPTCIGAFDNVIKQNPAMEPYLWQRGLALYYAKRYEEGVKQFETHQTVNSQDVENAVWHLLCAARFSDIAKARKKLIPITGDTRIPMSQVYEMFAGRMTPEEVIKAANTSNGLVVPGSQRHNLQLYYAHLYIGLYQEMLDKPKLAIESMKQAQKVNPLLKNNFMGVVAHVHLKLRGAKTEKEQPQTPNQQDEATEPGATSPSSESTPKDSGK